MPSSDVLNPDIGIVRAEQLDQWLLGISYHIPDGLCCPDYSCCCPELLAPLQERVGFVKAYYTRNAEALEHYSIVFLRRLAEHNIPAVKANREQQRVFQ